MAENRQKLEFFVVSNRAHLAYPESRRHLRPLQSCAPSSVRAAERRGENFAILAVFGRFLAPEADFRALHAGGARFSDRAGEPISDFRPCGLKI